MRFLLIGLLACVLAACASSPAIHYHMIEALPAAEGIHVQHGPVMGVERLNLPGYLETQAISYRRDDSRVIVHELDRWNEPVSEASFRVLIANLATLLPSYRLIAQPWSRQSQPALRLVVRIHQLEAVDGAVVLVADWQLLNANAAASPAQQGTFKAPLDNTSPEAIAAAYTQALAELSKAIADDAKTVDAP